jgi:hypothetical protein
LKRWVRYPRYASLARATALALLFAFPAQGADGEGAGRRLALVVGNAQYEAVYSLRNPVNDSHAVAETLEQLGFEVVSIDNAGREEFEAAVEKFSTMAEGAEATVFYFSGHGFQLKGSNYLVPTDARLSSAAAIEKETLRLDTIVSELQSRHRQTLIFLDACRNNPLPENMRDKDAEAGLAEIETGSGTFVAFATAPGNITRDGTGRNSPFTSALVEHMVTPGISISDMMIRVRNEVEEATAHEQTPWDQSSLRSQFYFNPEGEGDDALTEEDRELLLSLDPALRKKFEARFGLKIETVEEGEDGETEDMIATIVPAVTISAGSDDAAESDGAVSGEKPQDVAVVPNLVISAADDEEPGTPDIVRIPEPRPVEPDEPEVNLALLVPDDAPRPLQQLGEASAGSAPPAPVEEAATPAADEPESHHLSDTPAAGPETPVARAGAPAVTLPELETAAAAAPAAPAAEAETSVVTVEEPDPDTVAQAAAVEPEAPAVENKPPVVAGAEPQAEAVSNTPAVEPEAPAAEAEPPALIVPKPQSKIVADDPAIEPGSPAAEAEPPAVIVPEPQPEIVADDPAVEPEQPGAEAEAPIIAVPEQQPETVADDPGDTPLAPVEVEAAIVAEPEERSEALAEVPAAGPVAHAAAPAVDEHQVVAGAPDDEAALPVSEVEATTVTLPELETVADAPAATPPAPLTEAATPAVDAPQTDAEADAPATERPAPLAESEATIALTEPAHGSAETPVDQPPAAVAEVEAPIVDDTRREAVANAPATEQPGPVSEAEATVAVAEPARESADAPVDGPTSPDLQAAALGVPDPVAGALADIQAAGRAAPAAEADVATVPLDGPEPEAVADAPAAEPAAPVAKAGATPVIVPQPEPQAVVQADEASPPIAAVEPTVPPETPQAVAIANPAEPDAESPPEMPEVPVLTSAEPATQDKTATKPVDAIPEPEIVAMLEEPLRPGAGDGTPVRQPPAPVMDGSRAVPLVPDETESSIGRRPDAGPSSAPDVPRLFPIDDSPEKADVPAPPLVPGLEAQGVEPEKQLAAIDPSELQPKPVMPLPSEEPDETVEAPEDMPRAIQEQLARLGCYRSAIDGDWGPRSAKALLRYYATKKEAPDELDPNATLLAKLTNEETVVCTRTESDQTVTRKKQSGGEKKSVSKPKKQAPAVTKKPSRSKVVRTPVAPKPKAGPRIATGEKKKKLTLGTGAFR